MIRTAIALCCAASPAVAELNCTLEQTDCTANCLQSNVRFTIDATQFVDPQNANDPPRRQITTVTMDGATFVAEAILMLGGVRGFHEDAGPLGSRLMIVRKDGAARMALKPSNITLEGQCRDEN